MTAHARRASPADGLASGAPCAWRRQLLCAVRYGRCARAKRMRNVLRPVDRARNRVVAGKRRGRSELQSRQKLLRNPGEFHGARKSKYRRPVNERMGRAPLAQSQIRRTKKPLRFKTLPSLLKGNTDFMAR